LRDILVDELQNHLYLKSFWCDTRWSAYVPNQQICELPHSSPTLTTKSRLVPKVEFEDAQVPKPLSTFESSPTSTTFRATRQTRFLNDLATRPNDPPHDLSDLGFRQSSTVSPASLTNVVPPNPEANSFSYMETLIESLAVLGKLGSALDTVTQKLPNEIFTLVETTLDEVEERAEYSRRASLSAFNGAIGRSEGVYFSTDSSVGQARAIKGPTLKASCLRLAALESSAKRVDHEILRDLFWTLYSKLDAVAQGLRVVYEISNRVGSVSPTVLHDWSREHITSARGGTSKTLPGLNLALFSR
jgi:exocyst complex component 4